jgi:hypothetical protein
MNLWAVTICGYFPKPMPDQSVIFAAIIEVAACKPNHPLTNRLFTFIPEANFRGK